MNLFNHGLGDIQNAIMIILQPQCLATESQGNLEIDSATAGMNALVQNENSVNGLGWF